MSLEFISGYNKKFQRPPLSDKEIYKNGTSGYFKINKKRRV